MTLSETVAIQRGFAELNKSLRKLNDSLQEIIKALREPEQPACRDALEDGLGPEEEYADIPSVDKL